MKGLLQSIHPILQLISVVVIMIFVMIVIVFLGVFISIPFYGSDAVLSSLQNPIFDADNLSVLRYLQILQGIGLFIVPALICAYLFNSKPLNYIGFSSSVDVVKIAWLLVATLLIIPFINYLGFLNESIKFPDFLASVEDWMLLKEEQAKQLTTLFVKTDSVAVLAINMVMIAVIPAIGEELIFRGLFQRIFISWSRHLHVGVWTAAFLFSAMHMQFYGFFPRLLLGALLGYVYVYSGNIWYAIWIHFINNGVAVLLYFMSASHFIEQDIDTLGEASDAYFPLLCAVLAALSLSMFFRGYLKLNNGAGSGVSCD